MSDLPAPLPARAGTVAAPAAPEVSVEVACNCPFYGCSGLIWPRLLAHDSNQCALFLNSFTPCQQELQGKPVDWRVCPWAAEMRTTIPRNELIEKAVQRAMTKPETPR